jgi:hypothetical protein
VGIPAVAAVPAAVYVRVVLTLRVADVLLVVGSLMESLSGVPAVADVHVVVAWLTVCFWRTYLLHCWRSSYTAGVPVLVGLSFITGLPTFKDVPAISGALLLLQFLHLMLFLLAAVASIPAFTGVLLAPYILIAVVTP